MSVERIERQAQIVLITGVAGSGKTTISRLLSSMLGWEFKDADDFQTSDGSNKLNRGYPLNPQERDAWLERIHNAIKAAIQKGNGTIMAFPGLRKSDRNKVIGDNSQILVVHLDVPFAELNESVRYRSHSFFNPDLLEHEYAALEKPEHAFIVDGCKAPIDIIHSILDRMNDVTNRTRDIEDE